jgi:hypothetical protein
VVGFGRLEVREPWSGRLDQFNADFSCQNMPNQMPRPTTGDWMMLSCSFLVPWVSKAAGFFTAGKINLWTRFRPPATFDPKFGPCISQYNSMSSYSVSIETLMLMVFPPRLGSKQNVTKQNTTKAMGIDSFAFTPGTPCH